MSLPEKVYYRLKELAARWNKQEEYLLNLAAEGTLRMTCSMPLTICDLGEDSYNYMDKNDGNGLFSN